MSELRQKWESNGAMSASPEQLNELLLESMLPHCHNALSIQLTPLIASARMRDGRLAFSQE